MEIWRRWYWFPQHEELRWILFAISTIAVVDFCFFQLWFKELDVKLSRSHGLKLYAHCFDTLKKKVELFAGLEEYMA